MDDKTKQQEKPFFKEFKEKFLSIKQEPQVDSELKELLEDKEQYPWG